jgi:hypothetical protein
LTDIVCQFSFTTTGNERAADLPNYVYDIPRANLPTQRTDWRPVFTASNVGKGAQPALHGEWLILLEYPFDTGRWVPVGAISGLQFTLPQENVQSCAILITNAGGYGVYSYIPDPDNGIRFGVRWNGDDVPGAAWDIVIGFHGQTSGL